MKKTHKKIIIGLLILILLLLLLLGAYMLLRNGTTDMTEEETTEETGPAGPAGPAGPSGDGTTNGNGTTNGDGTTNGENGEETTGDTHEVAMNEQNNSGQNGSAVLEDLGSTTRVTINVTDLDVTDAATTQPAHIHSGTCDSLGEVVYALNDVEDGHSETVVEVSLQELVEGAFVINIQLAPEEADVSSSCGVI